MHRFLVFPLILGMVGLFFPMITIIEIALPFTLSSPTFLFIAAGRPFEGLAEIWGMLAPGGLLTGLLLGIGAATWDKVRNSQRATFGITLDILLLGNLGWCGLYALAIVGLNSVIFWFVFHVIMRNWLLMPQGPTTATIATTMLWVRLIPATVVVTINFIALAWATVRTVTTDDLLSPNVLLSKMRRSAQVEG